MRAIHLRNAVAQFCCLVHEGLRAASHSRLLSPNDFEMRLRSAFKRVAFGLERALLSIERHDLVDWSGIQRCATARFTRSGLRADQLTTQHRTHLARSQQREQDRLANMVRVRQHHDETINSEPKPAGRRHAVLERQQKVAVDLA